MFAEPGLAGCSPDPARTNIIDVSHFPPQGPPLDTLDRVKMALGGRISRSREAKAILCMSCRATARCALAGPQLNPLVSAHLHLNVRRLRLPRLILNSERISG